MKRLSLLVLLIFFTLSVFGQTEAEKFKEKLLTNQVEYKELISKELKNQLISHNFPAFSTIRIIRSSMAL